MSPLFLLAPLLFFIASLCYLSALFLFQRALSLSLFIPDIHSLLASSACSYSFLCFLWLSLFFCGSSCPFLALYLGRFLPAFLLFLFCFLLLYLVVSLSGIYSCWLSAPIGSLLFWLLLVLLTLHLWLVPAGSPYIPFWLSLSFWVSPCPILVSNCFIPWRLSAHISFFLFLCYWPCSFLPLIPSTLHR